MTSFVVRAIAATDIASAYAWYEEKREGLGEEFLIEVRLALDAAIENSLAHPIVERDTRRILVKRFPYGLFYRIVDDVVVVVACFHTRRDPKALSSRR